MNKFDIFCKVLIKNSEADNYHEAIDEWSYNLFFYEATKCICSQKIEKCFRVKHKYIDNKYLVIGSSCIKKFMKGNKRLIDNVNVIEYNERVQKLEKLYKKCFDCNQKFMLTNLKEHIWKKRCLKCYLNKK